MLRRKIYLLGSCRTTSDRRAGLWSVSNKMDALHLEMDDYDGDIDMWEEDLIHDPFLGVREENEIFDIEPLPPSMEAFIDFSELKEVNEITEEIYEDLPIPPSDEFIKTGKIETKGVSCPKCSKHLSQKSTLRKHLRIHNNDKPHKCPKCSYRSTQRQNLTRHMSTVHISGPYKFFCEEELCSFRTNRADKLKEHKKRKHKM